MATRYSQLTRKFPSLSQPVANLDLKSIVPVQRPMPVSQTPVATPTAPAPPSSAAPLPAAPAATPPPLPAGYNPNDVRSVLAPGLPADAQRYTAPGGQVVVYTGEVPAQPAPSQPAPPAWGRGRLVGLLGHRADEFQNGFPGMGFAQDLRTAYNDWLAARPQNMQDRQALMAWRGQRPRFQDYFTRFWNNPGGA